MSAVTVSTLSLSALPQMEGLEKSAKISAVQGVVGATRSALQLQKMQVLLRCGGTLESRFQAEQLNNNDVTYGPQAPCTAEQVPEIQKSFFTDRISKNPFNNNNQITHCTLNEKDPCSSLPSNSMAGWCYDSEKDKFWANSNQAGECAL